MKITNQPETYLNPLKRNTPKNLVLSAILLLYTTGCSTMMSDMASLNSITDPSASFSERSERTAAYFNSSKNRKKIKREALKAKTIEDHMAITNSCNRLSNVYDGIYVYQRLIKKNQRLVKKNPEKNHINEGYCSALERLLYLKEHYESKRERKRRN